MTQIKPRIRIVEVRPHDKSNHLSRSQPVCVEPGEHSRSKENEMLLMHEDLARARISSRLHEADESRPADLLAGHLRATRRAGKARRRATTAQRRAERALARARVALARAASLGLTE